MMRPEDMLGESLFESLIPQAEQRELDTERKHADQRIINLSRGSALFGVALAIIFLIEILTVPIMSHAIAWHIAVGLVAVPLLVGKLTYSSLRFIGYYRGDERYLQAGVPWFPLRVLAPFLVITTVLVIGSGVELDVAGPTSFSATFLAPAHFLLSAVWFLLMAFHVVAYFNRAARSTIKDMSYRLTQPRPKSSRSRVAIFLFTCAIGIVLATQLQGPIQRWETAFNSSSGINPSELTHPPTQYYNPTSLKRGRERERIHEENALKLRKKNS
ncbi:hypothetical protein [Ferrimicrobium sp.]|uniref:hypothetical protein n=2 Tax=Ferrimicrobium sp. TaxID=2926050 RepID=UPI002608E48C|nr:hypothetical protein [Ferrimicrobium sp.]